MKNKLFFVDPNSGKKMYFDFDYNNATTSTTIDDTIPEQWSKEVEDATFPKVFMNKFVVEKKDLISKPGDTVKISKRQDLTADGDLTETTMLQGHEEKLQFGTLSFVPAERGNAVAPTTQGSSKSILEVRKEAIEALGRWAAKKYDKDCHKAINAEMLGANIIYGGNATSDYDIDSGDKMTPALISRLKYRMEGADIPKFDAGDPTDPSAKSEGFYVAVLHPFQIYDLSQDTDYKAANNAAATIIAQKAVGPMFQGFDGIWDGVLIYRTSLISFAVPGQGYSTKIAKGFMMGPRAIGRAVGIFKQGPAGIWNEMSGDYGRIFGVAYRWFDQFKLLNSDRIYSLHTYATDLAA